MREIALHLLDIAENSVAAGAKRVEITIEEDLLDDRLRLIVQDDGRGMAEGLVAQLSDPFVTSRTTRKVGLGIPLFKAAAEACRGYLRVASTPGRGTRLEVEFQRSHIDRVPLGDLATTVLIMMVGWPQVHWVFKYWVYSHDQGAKTEFVFDDEVIKQELDGVLLTEPETLAFIRKELREGIEQVQMNCP